MKKIAVSRMMSARTGFVAPPLAVWVCAQAMVAFIACNNDSDQGRVDIGSANNDGAQHGDADADASVDAPVRSDAVASDDAPASADGNFCPGETVANSDSFAGVWTSTQAGETWTVTNNGGCSTWVGQTNGTICDSCVGTYAITGAATATLTLSCTPRSACSVSPVHTDTGTITRAGCAFSYAYNYGNGSSSETVTKTGETNANVCGDIDAGSR